MTLRTLLAPLLSAAILCVGPVWAQDDGDGSAEQVLRPAKLMTLSAEDAMLRREFFGRVSAKETVDLAFQVGGQIEQLPVVEGETYDEGALLAQLDLEPFERAVREAEVNLASAERDYARSEELSRRAVSEATVQDAETQRDLSRIALENAKDQLDDATLLAPFRALIVRRLVPNFATVGAGTSVLRVSDMSEIQVDIDVPEVLFRNAQTAENVTFKALLPRADTPLPLTIREFEAETAAVGQTYRVTLAFTDDPGAYVLPGASVTVVAEARQGEDTQTVVPNTALVYAPDRSVHVMVFQPSGDDPDIGTVAQTPVTIDIRDDGRVILTDGPDLGTEIVSAGASMLSDGQRVRRFTGIGE